MCRAARSTALALALVHLAWLGGACSKTEKQGDPAPVQSPAESPAPAPAAEPAASPDPPADLPATPVSPEPATHPSSPAGESPPPAAKPASDEPADVPPRRPAREPEGKPGEDSEETASLPAQGDTCEEGRCGKGLTCVEYYGVAGPKGPRLSSCEIPCKSGKGCPAGQRCATIADGPGQVCRPGT